jgi:HD-like signal output (HDOD) protein
VGNDEKTPFKHHFIGGTIKSLLLSIDSAGGTVVTEDDIQKFIAKIPPAPTVLKETLSHVDHGDLTKAAKSAESDPALKSYLRTLVNRPIYGFRNEVHDIPQIFGILGLSAAQQSLYNYMLSLLSPSSWSLFNLTATTFADLQAQLSRKWVSILEHEGINDKEIESAITLLPSSIIVCEALFKSCKGEVELLRSAKAIDYNTILKRLCKKDLFDICELIAHSWEMPRKIIDIVQAASGVKPADDPAVDRLGKWMHLLLFYELSQPMFIEAGLNDFIDFQVEYVQDVYEPFMALMEVA